MWVLGWGNWKSNLSLFQGYLFLLVVGGSRLFCDSFVTKLFLSLYIYLTLFIPCWVWSLKFLLQYLCSQPKTQHRVPLNVWLQRLGGGERSPDSLNLLVDASGQSLCSWKGWNQGKHLCLTLRICQTDVKKQPQISGGLGPHCPPGFSKSLKKHGPLSPQVEWLRSGGWSLVCAHCSTAKEQQPLPHQALPWLF